MGSFTVGNWLGAFAFTYLIHSTLLLGFCWAWVKAARPQSYYFRDWAWKSAATIGVLTALMQVALGDRLPGMVQLPSDLLGGEFQATPGPEASDWWSYAPSGRPNAVDDLIEAKGDVENPSGYCSDSSVEGDSDERSRWSRAANPTLADRTDLAASELKDSDLTGSGLAQGKGVAGGGHVGGDTSDGNANSVFGSRAGLLAARLGGGDGDRIGSFGSRAASWAQALAFALFSVCFCVGLFLIVFQSLWWRKQFRTASELTDGEARRALDQFLREHSIDRKIRLLTTAEAIEPFAFGLWRWTIVIPRRTSDRLDPDELNALMAHEVAHLVRGDIRWLWIGRLLCSCLAFQPLNFLARRQWQEAAEHLCDDWAVERGVESLSLARCLTEIAGWRLGLEPCDVALAAAGTKTTLVSRVERLVEQRRIDRWNGFAGRFWMTAIVVAAFAVVIAVTPRVAVPSVKPAIESVSTESNTRSKSDLSTSQLELMTAYRRWQDIDLELVNVEGDWRRVQKLAASLRENVEVTDLLTRLEKRIVELKRRREEIHRLLLTELEGSNYED